MRDEKLLRDFSDEEKGAYIGAIASLATADRTASAEEHEFPQALADSAELSAQQVEKINAAADDTSGLALKENLDRLKSSELRYSLLADLAAFAEADAEHSAAEKENIDQMAAYLGIQPAQVNAIEQFVHKASTSQASPEEVTQPGFLQSLGMDQKFQAAGLNMGSITKGLLAIAGPMILQRLLSRRGGGGNLGGMLGGSGRPGGVGGLGSLISILSGGRGIGSTGGLLGRVLKGGF